MEVREIMDGAHAVGPQTPLGEVPDPVTVDSSAGVQEAARIIVERGHDRLPAVEQGRLAGVVTRVGLLDTLSRA
jgi:CBS domain-containing protein